MSWIKSVLCRGMRSFAYAVTINLVIGLIIVAVVDKPDFMPMIPEYAAHFSSPLIAFCTQCLLTGVTSMAFGAGSVIMEIASWSLLKQSIVYFVLTALVWMPVSVFCWGLGKYTGTFISVTASYLVGYIISWFVQYKMVKQNIMEINKRLEELNEASEK